MTFSLKELAERIDDAIEAGDLHMLGTLLEECDSNFPQVDARAGLEILYFKANIHAGIAAAQSYSDATWGWDQPHSVQELLHLREALSEPAFRDLDIVRQCQIRTNLAGRLSRLGRSVEAIEQWLLVLQDMSEFAMAAGNLGVGLRSYAEHLYDPNHQILFLEAARSKLEIALSDVAFWDSGPDENARQHFADHLEAIHRQLDGIEPNPDFDRNAFSLGESDAERRYRRWSLDHRLFLNPLNDVMTDTVAAADVLHLPDHVYPIDTQVIFPGMYNILKQEFVTARYRLFDAIQDDDAHFSDRDVLLLDSDVGALFSYRLEQIKSAYRTAYSLFDKIALFINEYFECGQNPAGVSFSRIWGRFDRKAGTFEIDPRFRDIRNWPLRGLYFLSKDFFDPALKEHAAPDAESLDTLRHFLEHRFVALKDYDDGSDSSDVLRHESIDALEAKTLRLLKLARAALIYLSLSMRCEEAIRRQNADASLIVPAIQSRPIWRYSETSEA